MKISFIGAGNMATGMARLFRQAGHENFLSYSRDQAKLEMNAQEVGAKTGTLAEAIRFADVVVLAVPWQGAKEALQQAGDLQGKILWSIVNPFKADFSGMDVGTTTSGSEELAKLAKNAKFVAGWPLFADVLNSGNLKFGADSGTVFYCGDDERAKQTVSQLFEALGASTVDTGPLYTARLAEPAMFLLVNLAYAQKMGTVAYKLLQRS